MYFNVLNLELMGLLYLVFVLMKLLCTVLEAFPHDAPVSKRFHGYRRWQRKNSIKQLKSLFVILWVAVYSWILRRSLAGLPACSRYCTLIVVPLTCPSSGGMLSLHHCGHGMDSACCTVHHVAMTAQLYLDKIAWLFDLNYSKLVISGCSFNIPALL